MYLSGMRMVAIGGKEEPKFHEVSMARNNQVSVRKFILREWSLTIGGWGGLVHFGGGLRFLILGAHLGRAKIF